MNTRLWTFIQLTLLIEFLVADKVTFTGLVYDVWPCVPGKLKDCGQSTSFPFDCDPNKCHPDFEWMNQEDRNIIQPQIQLPDRHPLLKPRISHPTIHSDDSFLSWWKPSDGVNLGIPFNLTFDNTVCDEPPCDPNVYAYINSEFFPIDGQGFGDYAVFENKRRNYHFTFQLHTRFTYKGRERFKFTGDDDVWVFINNQLAIDLGGVHSAQSAEIALDDLRIPPFNLIVGETYNFDFFFAERHTWRSNCKIYTSIELFCPWKDHCNICQGDGQSCCTCDDNNACTTDRCDILTGECSYTAAKLCDDDNACTADSCDPLSGECQFSAIACNDSNPCTRDICDRLTGCSFVSNPMDCDDGNPCTLDNCDKITGECVHLEREDCSDACTCTQSNPCVPLVCDSRTGTCREEPLQCDDQNLCTRDYCRVNDQGRAECVNEGISCNDNDTCTQDACDPKQGCVNVERPDLPSLCDDGDACTLDTCQNNTCHHTNVSSPFPPSSNLCKIYYCDMAVGWVEADVSCRPTDQCQCHPDHGCLCAAVTTGEDKSSQTKVTGLVIGLVTLGALVGLGAFAFAGKKGFNYWREAREPSGTVISNPLYQESGVMQDNPLWEGSSQ